MTSVEPIEFYGSLQSPYCYFALNPPHSTVRGIEYTSGDAQRAAGGHPDTGQFQ